MGKRYNVERSDIIPTQDYLEQKTINFYKEREPTIPIPVAKDLWKENAFRAIDGHHNIAVNESLPAWIAESPKDTIPYEEFPEADKRYIDECNEQIKKRFDTALFYTPYVYGNSIESIESLVKASDVNI
ncbi:MAG: hypothetical protein ACQEP1_03300 [Nanobdellota archaeon]